MNATTESPVGSNLGKTLITGDDLEFHLQSEYADNLTRASELLAKGAEFASIGDDQADGDATEFMVKLRACYKTADNARTAEKSPYGDSAGLVHAFFKKGILDPLTALGQTVNRAQTDFKVAKANTERKVREEAAKLAREAEQKAQREAEERAAAAREAERKAARSRNAETIAANEAKAAELRRQATEADEAREKAAKERAESEKAAAAPAADLSRARGGRGGVSSLKTFTDFRDLDRNKIDLEALREHLPDKAIDQAVRSYIDAHKTEIDAAVKAGRQPLKGVFIFENHRSAGRA